MYRRFFKSLLCLIIGLTALALTGCGKTYYTQVNLMKMNDYYAGLFTERLHRFNVDVIQEQQQIIIILPNKIFNMDSVNFSTTGPIVLDEVGNLLRYYKMEVVKVEGVLPLAQRGEKEAKALAAGRAQSVIDYLWGQKVDISLAYALGKLRSEMVNNKLPSEYVAISFRRI